MKRFGGGEPSGSRLMVHVSTADLKKDWNYTTSILLKRSATVSGVGPNKDEFKSWLSVLHYVTPATKRRHLPLFILSITARFLLTADASAAAISAWRQKQRRRDDGIGIAKFDRVVKWYHVAIRLTEAVL